MTGLVAAVDVGGNFTDIVVVGPDGITVDKVPSSPPDFQDGFLEALRKAGVDGETGVVPDRIISRKRRGSKPDIDAPPRLPTRRSVLVSQRSWWARRDLNPRPPPCKGGALAS